MDIGDTRHFIQTGVPQGQRKYPGRRLDQKERRIHIEKVKNLPKRNIVRRSQEK